MLKLGPHIKQAACKGPTVYTEKSWQLMIWTPAQAGDRASKSGCFLLLPRTEPGSPAQEKEVRPTKPALMPSLPPLPLANLPFRHTQEHLLALQQACSP